MNPLLKKYLAVALLVCVGAAVAAGGSFYFYRTYNAFLAERLALEERKAKWQQLSVALRGEIDSFDGSAGVIIKDMRTGWRMRLNDEKPFAAASVVKIPIMAALFSAAGEGRLQLDRQVVLTRDQITGGSGQLKSMPLGTTVSVERLIELMVTHSDNTATNILIDMVGFDYLNGFFRAQGLKHTTLCRKMMDFSDRSKGVDNYTTAADISLVLEKIYCNNFRDPQVGQRCLELLKCQKVNDRIPAKLPDEVVVAHKTGLERNVCHDAGIVFTDNGDFLICVLTRSTKGVRSCKRFIADLAAQTYNTYAALSRN
jgi:beta-lactamase class A